MMSSFEYLLLVLAGIGAGFLNVVAGGGSMLTLPLLIFLGLPPAMANGTNRIAILWQNVFAINKFRRAGIIDYPYSIYLGLAAIPGAVLGGFLAVDIKGELFTRILSIIMLAVGLMIVFGSAQKQIGVNTGEEKRRPWVGILIFFLIGIYGGFIHAGVGFIIIFVLDRLHHYTMVRINSIKVIVAFVYTLAVVMVFIYNDLIEWRYGLTLAVGTSLGGWLGSLFSIKKGDKWIKALLLMTIVILSVKLWFYY